MKNTALKLALIATISTVSANASAQLYITEYMYSGGGDEFVEFTNFGTSSIDLTGWTYTTGSSGSHDISAFGTIAAGESVIVTQGNIAFFRDTWGLDSSVQIIGGVTSALSRNDQISILDSSNTLIDHLAYGDGDFDGSVRTREYSGNIPFTSLGLNDAFATVLSESGDVYGSWSSTEFDVGNPGSYPVPAPSALLTLGLAAACSTRRRRSL